MTVAALVVFGASLAAVFYVYAGYPALLLVLARLRPRPVHRAPVTPSLSVIVAAFDEEEMIEEKIRNTLADGYPPGLLEIVVASDGSRDATVARARAMGRPEVTVLDLPRRGKLPALEAGVAASRGDVLVFTDADVLLEPGSLGHLVESFADPEVGGVAGTKRLLPSDDGAHLAGGEGLYARFDEWQKELEGRIGSTVAAHGALYAVRRELFSPCAGSRGAADDMTISMRVVLAGHRLVHEGRAVALVHPPSDPETELRRKVRIANQVIRALLDLGPDLWRSGFYSLELVSHKLLRYLVPFFLALLLASNAALALGEGGVWGALLALQLGFYALAAGGAVLPRPARGPGRLLAVPYYFCLVNTAALLSVLSVIRGHHAPRWRPGAGSEPDSAP